MLTVTTATILRLRDGCDRVTLHTNMPGAWGEDYLSLDTNLPRGTADKYLAEHFPGVPVEVVALDTSTDYIFGRG